jgi:hypothetical protein
MVWQQPSDGAPSPTAPVRAWDRVGDPRSGDLPRWESFPPRDRRLLVELIVQTARRRVRDRTTARPGMGRR